MGLIFNHLSVLTSFWAPESWLKYTTTTGKDTWIQGLAFMLILKVRHVFALNSAVINSRMLN